MNWAYLKATVFQSIPLDGIVIVSSPQELVFMIVKKAYKMAKMMNVPFLGYVENMSHVKCPDFGKEIQVSTSTDAIFDLHPQYNSLM